MGKYNNSDLHNRFSDWHCQKCEKSATMTDIDRLWVEERNSEIVMVMELKYFDEFGGGFLKLSQDIVKVFFEENGVPFVVVKIRTKRGKDIEPDSVEWTNLIQFEIFHEASGFKELYSEGEFIEVVNDLKRFSDKLKEMTPEKLPWVWD